MSMGRDKRRRSKLKRGLFNKPSKAVIRKVAKKIIETLGEKK